MPRAGASASAQEKVALQSEARASFVATVGEAHEASELRAHLHRARRSVDLNTYDNSERTFTVLGDLLTAKAYDKSEHTFNVLGVLLTVNT